MPTYQYVCTECSEPLEAVQAFTDAPLTVCPTCSGKLRKVFSAVGVVFKGSGFYRNDSRDSGSKTATKTKKASTDSSKESGKSETKTSDSKASESKNTTKATESASAKPKASAAATA